MTHLPHETTDIISTLQSEHIRTVLYGSQGVSLYLGAFKQFGDIDLLVDDAWLTNKWQELITIMQAAGFTLVNEREHEFINPAKTNVAFASTDILIRDGIVDSLSDYTQEFSINNVQIVTLKPEVFTRAYEFSEKDGYRKEVRGKSDREVIRLLEEYLARISNTVQ